MGLKRSFTNGSQVEGLYIFEFINGKITGFPLIHLTSFDLDGGRVYFKSSSMNVAVSGNNLRALLPLITAGFYLKEDSERFDKKTGNDEEIWISKIEVEELDSEDMPSEF